MTIEALRREIETWSAERREANGWPADQHIDVVRGIVPDISVYRDAERQLRLFLAGSLLLALAAGANTSLFLLARAPGRRRELAIRLSIGAAIPRLARQLLTESGLLVSAGALLGLVASIGLASFLRSLAFLSRAGWTGVTLLDWRVLSLVGIFLLILTCLVSLAPIRALGRLRLAPSSRPDAAHGVAAQRLERDHASCAAAAPRSSSSFAPV